MWSEACPLLHLLNRYSHPQRGEIRHLRLVKKKKRSSLPSACSSLSCTASTRKDERTQMHYPIWMACPSLPEPPTESLSRCLELIGEGNGNPLQCSCLENPRDGGAWGAAIYGVSQSRTRLKQLSSSSRADIQDEGSVWTHLTAYRDVVAMLFLD